MKTTNYLQRSLFVALASTTLLISVSCTQKPKAKWEEQMELLKNEAWKNKEGDLKELKLISYTDKGKIESDEEKAQVIEEILGEQSPIASVSQTISICDTTITEKDTVFKERHYPAFDIVTIRQAIDAGTLSEEALSTTKRLLNDSIKVGFGTVEMIWEYKGKQIQTTGIIDDKDNVLDMMTMGLFTGGSTRTVSKKTDNQQ